MIRALAFTALCALALSCAGTTVRSQTTANDALIATARDHGAQLCAPVELATAETHNEFAAHQLDEGNLFAAQRDADIAADNAQRAIDKSPKSKCVPNADADGDGIPDSRDQCPNTPEDKDGFQDADGCPDLDNDGDGIPDTADKCPNEPEDKDGFQDADGCPDLDNDADGIPDSLDLCPNEPEDKDGFQDEDGCPDPDNDKDGIPDSMDQCPNVFGVPPDGCPKKYNLVTVTATKIEIHQTVYFDTNKATIKPVSFALLNEVALAMSDNPTLKVEVQGHTDSQGNGPFNMVLSQHRADSVRAYLIKRGIDKDRMTSVGYGKTQPVADNRTASGRSQNRRVEFVITSR